MRRAIIADDEEMAIEIVKYLIERYELPIDVVGRASSGDEALNLIKQLKPDIVFMDIQMPVLSGLEVIEKADSGQDAAVDYIIITAYNYFEYAQTSLRLGAKDILLKPIEPEQFLETMQRVLGYRYSDNQLFNSILEYVNLNFREELELKECAERFHTSASYVARMFKKYYSVSFITYVNDLRIKKAQELLRDTGLSIKEVAYQVGYNNLNYFYRVFKKNTGVTPNMYKK